MSMKGVFQTAAGKLRDAILKDDVLVAERLAREVKGYKLSELLDEKLAAALTPQMAAVLTGKNGAANEKDIGEGTPFLHVLSRLLEARNIPALDVIIRKEKNHFNGRHGTEAMLRVVLSPIEDSDRLRYIAQMLEQGHSNMTFPERAVAFANRANLRDVVAFFATKGLIDRSPPFMLQQPEPDRR